MCRNVGFLKYWTAGNIPLFVLAVPMLALMSSSALVALKEAADVRTRARGSDGQGQTHDSLDTGFETAVWARLAMPQLMLTVLALTSFHVQTITRIASGYVLPYLLLGSMMTGEGLGARVKQYIEPKWVVRWMIMYATIQGGLYASFLPPA